MSNDLDDKIRAALRTIPDDPDVTTRLVTDLAEARRPLGGLWLAGGALVASIAGFATAFLQGPEIGGAGDAMALLLGGAL